MDAAGAVLGPHVVKRPGKIEVGAVGPAAVLDDELGQGSHPVAGVMTGRRRCGRRVVIVTRGGAGGVGAVVAMGGMIAVFGSRQDVVGDELALGVVHGEHVRRLHGLAGQHRAAGGVDEETHVLVQAAVGDGDDLALAEDAVIEDGRRLADGVAALAHPVGIVVQRPVQFPPLHPAHVVEAQDVLHERRQDVTGHFEDHGVAAALREVEPAVAHEPVHQALDPAGQVAAGEEVH